jgi:predicted DsbA family dithiol-disulfide isomerase
VLDVTLFTDPACPFAFTAEPSRWRLRWFYGDRLRWTVRMIVLTREPGEAEKLAGGADGLQARYGMPIARGPHARAASSEPACRAVVAARLQAPDRHERLLRALRVRVMLGGLLDDQALIDGAARDAGLDPAALADWCARPDTAEALEADAAAARDPLPAARALDHKLGGPAAERRYTAPSYVIAGHEIPGFNPVEVYETAVANLDPALPRRPKPTHVRAVLEWAQEPLATAEVAALIQTDLETARKRLRRHATEHPAGADAYWS